MKKNTHKSYKNCKNILIYGIFVVSLQCKITCRFMAEIKTEKEYRAILKRIDELLPLTGDNVPEDSPENIELALLSDLVAEYEDVHYPITAPSLAEVLKLRMYEMGLTQAKAAELLGISSPRMSEIMHGKTEPSLSLARTMCLKLNITPEMVLGL